MNTSSWLDYDLRGEFLFKIYEDFNFSKLHRPFLPFLPEKGAYCLDVGAGSGRDAAAMAKRGYNVTAVEPSNSLLNLAKSQHSSKNIRWIADSLPALKKLQTEKNRYNFILLSAVWMHVLPTDRETAFANLSRLLKNDGAIAMTIRYGPVSSDRQMYPIDLDELFDQASRQGLRRFYLSRLTKDAINRGDVSWRKIVLKKSLPVPKTDT